MLYVGVFDRRIVILNEHFLEELDGEGRLANTTIPHNNQLVRRYIFIRWFGHDSQRNQAPKYVPQTFNIAAIPTREQLSNKIDAINEFRIFLGTNQTTLTFHVQGLAKTVIKTPGFATGFTAESRSKWIQIYGEVNSERSTISRDFHTDGNQSINMVNGEKIPIARLAINQTVL